MIPRVCLISAEKTKALQCKQMLSINEEQEMVNERGKIILMDLKTEKL